MDASAYAFAHGVRHTRATLRTWQRTPGRVVGALGARAPPSPPSGCSRRSGSSPRSPPATRRSSPAAAVRGRRRRRRAPRAARATCSCSRCTRWPASRASSPAARCRCRPSTTRRLALGPRARRAASRSASSSRATTFSLSAQAYLIGHTLAGVSGFLHVSPALLLLGVLPHAIPELTALFLPLAAWIIASRRGEWEQLLAATLVTVAIAVPMLVARRVHRGLRLAPPVRDADPHPPPIVRQENGWTVTIE